jgi:flagellar basal-body rod modification protein FlgD
LKKIRSGDSHPVLLPVFSPRFATGTKAKQQPGLLEGGHTVSRISNTNASNAASSASQNGIKGNDFSSVDLDAFLDLMITELQNQDPLNPTDNSEFLQQITQIRTIGSTNELSRTLASFSSSTELTTASSLIGKKVKGLDDQANEIDGVVQRVSVQIDEKDRNIRHVRVHVGDKTVDMSNVREIVQAED